jgi:hypothetical protein
MKKANPDHKNNLYFVSYEKVLEKVLERFIEFNENEENSAELIKNFKNIIERYKNFQYGENGDYKWDLSFKFDLAKFLSIFESRKEVLVHDFDQIEHFNIKIPENSKNMHKFILGKHNCPDNRRYESYQCMGTINYLPKSLEKPYLIFFEHTMKNLTDLTKQTKVLMHSEPRLAVLFEYLASKNFKTNKEIENFFTNISYQDLYKEFNEKYQEFLNEKSRRERSKKFYKAHFENKDQSFMHLKKNNEEILAYHFFPKSNFESRKSGAWHKTNKEIESMSSHKNIFDQIASGLKL